MDGIDGIAGVGASSLGIGLVLVGVVIVWGIGATATLLPALRGASIPPVIAARSARRVKLTVDASIGAPVKTSSRARARPTARDSRCSPPAIGSEAEALGVLETCGPATLLRSVDAAVKGANVGIGEIRLADEIRPHAAAAVMDCRNHRDRLARHVDPE